MTAQPSHAAPARGEATVKIDGVSKWFGPVVAVNDVSLEIFPGVTGLLGPNGAGKTTLLHLMSGLAKPSEGRVSVLDVPVRRNPSIYRRVGVMTEHEAIYDFLTGRQFVEFNARLQGLDDIEAAVDRAIDQVDLAGDQNRRMGGYSRGMRQRMRLAATMVHDPEVLLLDEPLSGTDPRQRLRFIDIVRRLGAEGRTVLISSHILEEVEAAADRIVLLIAGKVAASGDYRTIRRKLNDRPYVVRVTSSDPRALGAGLLRIGAVESVALDEDNHLRVRSLDVAALQRALPGVAQREGIRLLRVEPLDDTLESVFEYLAER